MTPQNTATSHSEQTDARNSSLSEACTEVRFSEMEFLPWDNPDNIVSAEVETLWTKMKDIMTGIMFLIGGPANVINMAVFYKQGLKDRVNLCLFSLSLTDCLYLTACMCLHGEDIYLIFSSKEIISPTFKFLVNGNFVVFMGLSFVSQFLSAIIACERCYCVFSPLKYQDMLRTKTMGFIIVVVYVMVLSLFFIVAIRDRVGCIHDPETGAVIQAMVAGTFYNRHKDLIDFLDSVVFGVGFPGGTMVVVLIATILTAVKLRQIMTWRTGASSSLSAREVALTKLLIGGSVFFIICTSPNCVFRVVSLFLPEMRVGGRYHNFYYTTLWTLVVFNYTNFTFNFIIYYVMGSKYRETVRTIFTGKVQDGKFKN